MTLFWRKGYHATSLKDLEAALHMKPGSIYAAFHSKQALYLATLDRYMQINQARLSRLVVETGSPLTALAQFLRGFVEESAEARGAYACMVVKALLEATEDDAAIAKAARACLDSMAEGLAAVFQAALDAGELPENADVALLGRRFQMNLTALRIEAQRSGPSEQLTKLADDMSREVESLRVPDAALQSRVTG